MLEQTSTKQWGKSFNETIHDSPMASQTLYPVSHAAPRWCLLKRFPVLLSISKKKS